MSATGLIVKRGLRFVLHLGIAAVMEREPNHSEHSRAALPRAGTREERPTREERLAAKLRENLRRRKTQARELSANESSQGPIDPEAESAAALPKPPSES